MLLPSRDAIAFLQDVRHEPPLPLVPVPVPAKYLQQMGTGNHIEKRAPAHIRTQETTNPSPAADPLKRPFGIVAAASITPDVATLIGNWTDQEFDGALRPGRPPMAPDSIRPCPTPLHQNDPEVVRTIRAYLRTLEPVHHEIETNRPLFPYNIRAAVRIWGALYFNPGVFKSDSTKSAEWNRGAYLLEGPGHCHPTLVRARHHQ